MGGGVFKRAKIEIYFLKAQLNDTTNLTAFNLAVWILYAFQFSWALKFLGPCCRFQPETFACTQVHINATFARSRTHSRVTILSCSEPLWIQFSEQSAKHEQLCGLGEVSCSLFWLASSVPLLCCIHCPQREAALLRGGLFATGSKAAGLQGRSLWSSVAPQLHRLSRVLFLCLLSFCVSKSRGRKAQCFQVVCLFVPFLLTWYLRNAFKDFF